MDEVPEWTVDEISLNLERKCSHARLVFLRKSLIDFGHAHFVFNVENTREKTSVGVFNLRCFYPLRLQVLLSRKFLISREHHDDRESRLARSDQLAECAACQADRRRLREPPAPARHSQGAAASRDTRLAAGTAQQGPRRPIRLRSRR